MISGFFDIGAFGGEIETPHAENLALCPWISALVLASARSGQSLCPLNGTGFSRQDTLYTEDDHYVGPRRVLFIG